MEEEPGGIAPLLRRHDARPEPERAGRCGDSASQTGINRCARFFSWRRRPGRRQRIRLLQEPREHPRRSFSTPGPPPKAGESQQNQPTAGMYAECGDARRSMNSRPTPLTLSTRRTPLRLAVPSDALGRRQLRFRAP